MSYRLASEAIYCRTGWAGAHCARARNGAAMGSLGQDPVDLVGTVDERIEQLSRLQRDGSPLSEAWLHRQLRAALSGWASAESVIDIDIESRPDY